MKRPIVAPAVEQIDGRGGRSETHTTHPAFAQIGASRTSGGHTTLYGSDFHHNAYITIRIFRSELRRSLSNDWHFGKEQLIEVALSEAQWATFVSSPNVGDGVPCTLRSINYEMVPELPDPVVRHEQFGAEMAKQLAEAQAKIRSLIEQIDAMNLPKGKAETLKSELRMAGQHIGGSVQFVAAQFDEHMEGSIEKAKAEIHGYMTGAIMRAGIDALGAPAPLEIEGPSDATAKAPPHA